MKRLVIAVLVAMATINCAGCSDDKLHPIPPACPIGSLNELPCAVDDAGIIWVDDKIPSSISSKGLCRFGVTSCIEVLDENGEILEKKMECLGHVTPAEEICDGLDNDCDCPGDTNLDGVVCGCTMDEVRIDDDLQSYFVPGKGCDEGVDTQFDNDIDGHSICGWDGTQNTMDDDCNDENPNIHPKAPEVCDGIDNNCNCHNQRNASDRDTNEDSLECSCSPDENGNLSALDELGVVSPTCTDTVGASLTELCCDANVDESLPNSYMCFEDKFGTQYDPDDYVDNEGHFYQPCAMGKKQCVNGAYNACDATTPQEEICDGLDNDCDGFADNNEEGGGLITIGGCYDGPAGTENVGICHPGNQVCVAPELYCWDQQVPEQEFCDGVDNDCNGIIDDGIADQICNLGCGPGPDSCVIGGNGDWACMAPGPAPEICDGLDNDCDGAIDEEVADFDNNGIINENDICPCQVGDVMPCQEDPMYYAPVNVGDQPVLMDPACGIGIRQCVDPNNLGIPEWSVCFFTGTTLEVCDGWDNDCECGIDAIDLDPDPNIDDCEILNVACYDGDPATLNVGECVAGYRECSGQGFNGPCIDQVLPQPEICDGLDNDCDNEIDEDLDPHEKVDMLFLIDGSGSMGTAGQNNTPIGILFQSISQYVSTFQQALCPPTGGNGPDEECHRFAVAVFPPAFVSQGMTYGLINSNNGQVFKPIGPFVADVNAIVGTGGMEPSFDAAYAGMSPQPAQGNININMTLDWREDAYPYLILLTDEPPQTWNMISLQDVLGRMNNCTVGCCVAHQDCEESPGGNYEFYVATLNSYIQNWGGQGGQLATEGRIKDFAAFNVGLGGSVGAGINLLNEVFEDVCIPGQPNPGGP